jgi:hypothetical protein
VRSREEELFVACAAKTCCETDLVYLPAEEVARIAGMLGVEPEAFAVAEPERTRLAHRETGGCVFLLRLPDGAGRCGLGDDRPAPCRAPIGSASCTCRAWAAAP